ncbi:MAG: metallophosphoesterase family protein [Candidatus Wallbacteria bacterium]|nr:metallophosphoesterase family protein [Candidatus Wallbacteria bacterium]
MLTSFIIQAGQPDHIALSWTGDPVTTMTVTWRSLDSAEGIVSWKESGVTSEVKSMQAAGTGFYTGLGSEFIYSAEIRNLKPETKYEYRVGDGKSWSSEHTFATAGGRKAVKFLVFGDSQSGLSGSKPYGAWHDTVHNAYLANPDAGFIMNVGDLVDEGQSAAHWNAWFNAAAGVIDEIPEMAVQGNHETMGGGTRGRPVYFLSQFTLPENGPSVLAEQAYSFDYGPLHIAVLDSQQTEEKKSGDIFTPQKAWLESDLKSGAAWKIVVFHKNPYCLKRFRSTEDVREAFCPVIEGRHADLVINGHDHGVARTKVLRNGKAVERPSQGTVYLTAGRSGGKIYGDLEKNSHDDFFFNPEDQPDYVVITATDAKLAVRILKQDGSLIDSFGIDKEKDSLTN